MRTQLLSPDLPLFHPALIMIFFISVLLVINKQCKLFKFIAFLGPIMTAIILILGQGEYSYELYNLKLIWEFDDFNKLLGFAFLIVLLAANSYALGQKKYSELIFGFAYGASIFISLLAKDFISMFVGLELMMIISSIIIFIGNNKSIANNKNELNLTSSHYATKYFQTHLISSNMILIGITHIMSVNNSSEIMLVTDLIGSPEYSNTMLYIMFIGMVINIAAFPFSGWMVNYYNGASASGSLYLINFTTKLSIILLLKIFIGFEPLKYIALIMIIYAGFKAIFEDNIFALLCYLSIVSMGVMVLGIAFGDKSTLGVVCYLFIHIIYKSLLSIVAATLRDRLGITSCSNLSKFGNKSLLISTLIGTALLINIPFTLSFYSKIEISHSFAQGFFYLVILLAGIISIIALPWKECFKLIKIKPNKSYRLKLNFYNRFSLILMSISAIATGFIGFLVSPTIDFTSIYKIDVNIYFDALKQLGIFGFSAVIITSLMMKNNYKKNGQALNILENIGYIFSFLYKYWKNNDPQKTAKEKWRLDSLEEQMLKKLSVLHNQQTAVFIVFCLLITMLTTLIISLY